MIDQLLNNACQWIHTHRARSVGTSSHSCLSWRMTAHVPTLTSRLPPSVLRGLPVLNMTGTSEGSSRKTKVDLCRGFIFLYQGCFLVTFGVVSLWNHLNVRGTVSFCPSEQWVHRWAWMHEAGCTNTTPQKIPWRQFSSYHRVFFVAQYRIYLYTVQGQAASL